MRKHLRAALALAALTLGLPAATAGPRDFVIFATRMGGDTAAAKPYVDRFARHLEMVMGWPTQTSVGTFFASRKEALAALEQTKPGFAVVEPSLYFELRARRQAVVLAQVVSRDLNSPQLVVVAKDPAIKTLGDLTGKRLFTQLADSGKYLSNVVFDAKGPAAERLQLKQVGIVQKGVRAVLRGEADATVLDPEQLAEAKKLDGGEALRTIYTSPQLPGLLVVAFAHLSDAKKLGTSLIGMCATGGPICKELHIENFEVANAALLSNCEKRYEKP